MKQIVVLIFFCLILDIYSSDLLQYPWYKNEYKDFSKKNKYKVGIIVIAYNRPEYLKRVIQSLQENPESKTLPFFFMLDGGVHSTQKENIKIINESNITYKYIIVKDRNYGCGRSILDARRFMFEWCCFEKVIVFEDDLVVSPEYISLVLSLHAWSNKNYENIGVVSCFSPCFLTKNKKEKKLNQVEQRFDYFWGYCLDQKVYFAMKSMLDIYEKKCLIDIENGKANQKQVAEWFILYWKQYNKKGYKKKFPNTLSYKKEFLQRIRHMRKNPHKRRDGQDFEMRFALYLAGYIKINTVVNRAVYIGKKGVHHGAQKWEQEQFEKIVLDRFESDTMRQNFSI